MKISLCLLLLFPISVFGQGGLPTQPYIYVEGKAGVENPADMVTLQFEIVARQTEEKKANAEVQAKANAVFDLTKSRGLANDDVIAQSLRFRAAIREPGELPKEGEDHRLCRLSAVCNKGKGYY